MNLFAARRPGLFLLFIPCIATTVLPLLVWSLLGLLLIVPGMTGLAGLGGVLFAWGGLIAPEFVVRHRNLIKVLLCLGLVAAVIGVALGIAGGTTTNGKADYGYLGLACSSLCYATVAGFFLAALPPLPPRELIVPAPPPPPTDISMDAWAIAFLAAVLPPMVSIGMLLYSMDPA